MIWVLAALGSTPLPRVVNGTPTDAHPEVVALASIDGGGEVYVFCTGTLVHPQYVVTAAHCVGALPVEAYVVFGRDLREGQLDAQRLVTDAWPHPGYDPDLYLNDIGVLQLETPVTDVRLSAVNDEPPNTGWIGQDLHYVGFGDPFDGAFETGTKRFTDVAITELDPQYLYTSDPDTNICQGDSGGPAFEATPDGFELAGITAFTINGCVGGDAGATRIDTQLSWLLTHIPELVFDAADLPPIEGDTDTDTDADTDTDTDVDADWGEPTVPTKGTYPLRLRCDARKAPHPGVLGAFSIALLLLTRRRGA